MVVVEVAGPPGAGKTTLLPAVLRACEAAGLRPYTVAEAARVFAGRTAAGRAARALPPGLRRRVLWAIYYAHCAVGAVRLAVVRPALARYVLGSQRRRPAAADARHRRVVYWYFRTAGSYAFLRSRGRSGEALVIDEGFVHRAVQLHASSVERPRREQIAAYARLLPPCDLVVVVHAPVAVCLERVRARGVWPRLRDRQGEQVARFVANAHHAVGLAAEAVRRNGRPVVRVDNAGDLDGAQRPLRSRVEQALRSSHGAGASAPRPVRWLPRPARTAGAVKALARTPAIDPATCAAVLQRYGLFATRRPANLAFGARNRNVVVQTSAGRKVLRRHRETSPLGSIRHEHAVLTELERVGFPAVRLTRTPLGATVVEHAGERYALFDFEDGRNLSSCAMRRSDRLRLLDTAGRTLARLHRQLAAFTPPAAHHLGYRNGDGGRTHDLQWHLDALGELAACETAPGSRHPVLALLRDQRRALAGQLARLDEVLAAAALPRVIVHGDFGIHNLLFRRDGVAVVTDFELARREWRLVDLVIVLSRVRGDRAGAFLDGYRREAELPPSEWRHLPDVWQYHRLTGAIQSWRNYLTYGGAQRLDTALDRVHQAAAAGEEATASWR